MSVRIKTLIVICLTFLALLGILYFTSRWFLLQDANIAEEKSTTRDVTRLLATLDSQIAGIDATVSDWAPWDDTYEFISSGDTGYIDSNLPNNEAFTNIGVELMLFINNSGQIIFGKMVDLDSEAEIPLPESLYSEVQVGSRLLSHKDPSDKMAGILSLPEGPMIIASQPIVTSQGEGPIRGTLIMGRFLDKAEIAKLSQTTQLSISVFPYNGDGMPSDVALARKSLVGVRPIFVAPQSEASVSGYTLVNDVYGNPALILRVNAPREAYTQAKTSTRYLGLALLSIGIVLGLVTMLLLERMVIVRLTSLNSSVLKIGSQGTASSRVVVNGNDEIFVLATSVNSMLDSLENSRVKERESEERYKNLATISPVGIFRTDQNGTTTYVNPTWCNITGLSVDEALGHGWLSAVHPEDKESLTNGWQETTRLHKTSFADYRFVRPDGTVAWVMGQAIPEMNSENQFVGYIGTITEITERKRAEEALARQTEELRQRNEELARLYRASGSLLSGASLNLQELAQAIIGVVKQEFGQANCGLLLIRRDSNELQRLAAAGPYNDQVKYLNLVLDGPGLIPGAIRTRKVVNIGDVHSAADYVQGWDAAQSELVIPLKIRSDVIGVIDVQSAQPDAFSPDDERLMSIFAERAALSLEHSRLNTQTEARIQQLVALRKVDMAISSSFDINLTLGILLDQVTGQLGAHAADILIFNEATQTFKLASERGFHTRTLQYTQLNLGKGNAWRAVRERRMVVISNLQAEPAGIQRSPDLSGEEFVTYLGVPLIAKGQIRGVLEIFHREPVRFEPEWYSFLEILAGQAAIAIDNFELFNNLQSSNSELSRAYDSTLEAWASALELRDHETGGHTRRATDLIIRLAQAMGVKDNDIVHIYRGTLLHDIGKMGVPDSIVLKPGPLTEEEWVSMRKHPQYAYEMLSSISFLRLALDIPYCHHEKWDGTGYPRGLKEEQIPLSARIFAVVDVWDALISDRPYRKAWSQEKALELIREQSGFHFDPKVVEIFLREVKLN